MTETLQLKIEKLVYGGEGLGHHEGRTVFVPFVLPGEAVTIEPVDQKKKFMRGRLREVLEPSPTRIAAPCPYFGICGGCDYQHIPYDGQVQFKAEILRETFQRLGHVHWDGPIIPHASPAYEYRNRAQWKISQLPGKPPAIGYFEKGSQKLVAVDQCPISSPLLQRAIVALKGLLAAGKMPELREAEGFVNGDDSALLLNLSFETWEGSAETLFATVRAELPALESLLVHNRRNESFALAGPGYLSYRAAGHEFRVGHLSFFQINRFLVDELPGIVLDNTRGKLALDLYAGVGLFTLPLAQRFQRVIGVESNAAAVRDLEFNLQESSAPSAAVRDAQVETFLAQWNETPDFVVIDPPRAGVPEPALRRLAKLAPAQIAYLSCDPATLARDLAVLAGTAEKLGPYQISELHVVDIFPQTYHMEALVRLSRRA